MNNRDQQVISIPLTQLHLWTENPRDPIDESSKDADIIRRAIENKSGNWNLDALINEMGDLYLYNELPTVVQNADGSYTVYDGNRRIAIMKCVQDPDLYQEATSRLPLFNASKEMQEQTSIPCNVCTRKLALDIVERVHKSSNKWGKLQYEHFLHNFRDSPKGRLMLLDEATGGSVGKNPKLNEEYVQQRLLTDSNLNDIGFSVIDGELASNLPREDAIAVLQDIGEVRKKDLSNARSNPGKLKEALAALSPEKYSDIAPFSEEKGCVFLTGERSSNNEEIGSARTAISERKIRRKPVTKQQQKLFGGTLRPKGQRANEIYRAIDCLYSLYRKNPSKHPGFLPIIAFSMRFFLEICGQEYFAEYEPERDLKDGALKPFLKLAKRQMKESCESKLLTTTSLEAEWLNGNINLEGVVSKWAHGTLPADESAILRHSQIIGAIVRKNWSD